jgi:uncharacterized SAM-dependent methyltransferase
MRNPTSSSSLSSFVPAKASQKQPAAPGAEAVVPLSEFGREMQAGLARSPRSISPKFFYDAAGSQLFDRICELPEYYPTRTELRILRRVRRRDRGAGRPERGDRRVRRGLAHQGAAAAARARVAEALPADRHLGRAPREAAQRLRRTIPICWCSRLPPTTPCRSCCPRRWPARGGASGSFRGRRSATSSPEEALAFLQLAARMLRGGGLLIGVDLVKDPGRLHAAYNDAQGVTAEFNLNLLRRANAELDADFDLDGFAHAAFYNAPRQRIEMHLVSRRAQSVSLNGEAFGFEEGETIHTEYSHKFTVDGLRALAVRAGFRPKAVWTDPERLFSVHWLEA